MGSWAEGGKERSGPGFSVQTNKRIHFLAALPELRFFISFAEFVTEE